MPWLVLGGAGGGVWFAMQGGDEPGVAAGDPDDPIDPLTGTADVIGTFAGE